MASTAILRPALVGKVVKIAMATLLLRLLAVVASSLRQVGERELAQLLAIATLALGAATFIALFASVVTGG